MNIKWKIGLAMLASVGLVAATVEGLYAQTKPQPVAPKVVAPQSAAPQPVAPQPVAYVVCELTVTNEDAFDKQFAPAIQKTIFNYGGRFLALNDSTIALAGTPPDQRVVILQFDNLSKAQAWAASQAYKDAMALGAKYSKLRLYVVGGVP
jgi:uncharacterized protein (DUF1330 family)